MTLSLHDITLTHADGRTALAGVNLAVETGAVVAVIGPSGAGKTSLLELAALAQRPSTGCLRLHEAEPWSLAAGPRHNLRRQLFLAPQTPPLPPRQRVVTAVLAGRLPGMGLVASLRSLFYPSAMDEAHRALSALGMEQHLFERVDRLSGGERQRVGLARAMVSSARLWLLDEPLSALDPGIARQCLDALLNTARARGATVLASLHQVELARAGFDRLVGLQAGRILFDRPATEVTDANLRDLYERGAGAPAEAQPAPPVAMNFR
jgi:phosphonate transport system ATP-binding protein